MHLKNLERARIMASILLKIDVLLSCGGEVSVGVSKPLKCISQ